MAAAVDGPPMLAFDAMIASCKETFNSFDPSRTISIFTTTIIKQNTKSSGAVFMISGMLAGTPITTKKIYIKNDPTSSAPFIFSKYFGKAVVSIIVNVVIIRYGLPKS